LTLPLDDCLGSWLCENAKPLKDDRRSYLSTTALGHQLAIAFNFKIELKNVIDIALLIGRQNHGMRAPWDEAKALAVGRRELFRRGASLGTKSSAGTYA
jgi:hypothetical protein